MATPEITQPVPGPEIYQPGPPNVFDPVLAPEIPNQMPPVIHQPEPGTEINVPAPERQEEANPRHALLRDQLVNLGPGPGEEEDASNLDHHTMPPGPEADIPANVDRDGSTDEDVEEMEDPIPNFPDPSTGNGQF